MTHEELAKKIGLARTSLTELLNGKRTVGPKTAKRVAAYLNDPDWRRYVEISGPELRQLLLPGLSAGDHSQTKRSIP